MLQGASSYAGFTYILDNLFAAPNKKGKDREFDFTDAPVEDRGY